MTLVTGCKRHGCFDSVVIMSIKHFAKAQFYVLFIMPAVFSGKHKILVWCLPICLSVHLAYIQCDSVGGSTDATSICLDFAVQGP